MDNSFNGLRYSSSLGCLIDDGGEKIRMCRTSNQIFSLLKQNLNKLVTREHLLDKVPTNGFGNSEHRGLGTSPDDSFTKSNDSDIDVDCIDECIDECIEEIRHVVGNDRLKTIPRVGFLLTPDIASIESKETLVSPKLNSKMSSTVLAALSNVRVRPLSALVQLLVFHSQWISCSYQKNQRAWIGGLVLLAVLLLASANSTANPTAGKGHLAFDRTGSSVCPNSMTCSTCTPSIWLTSSVFARSNWFLSTGCL